MSDPLIRPLREKTLQGVLYEHRPQIKAKLFELIPLSVEELIERCTIQFKELPDYVPSECLVYFLRINHVGDSRLYELLFRLLAERVLRRLPNRVSSELRAVSLTESNVTDEVFDRFMVLLGKDRLEHIGRLDYFEVCFDGALKRLRLDAEKKIRRHEGRTDSLEVDPETGELPAHLEEAVGLVDPFDSAKLEDADYRARLVPAIDALPHLQRRIIEMLRLEIPIYSEDPSVMTISRALGKSDKTIRNHRDRAYLALAAILKGDRSP